MCARPGAQGRGVRRGRGTCGGRSLIAEWGSGEAPGPFDGRGSCYIEFGKGRVGRVDIDFLSGPERTGVFNPPSQELVDEKTHFGTSRRARWFGTGV